MSAWVAKHAATLIMVIAIVGSAAYLWQVHVERAASACQSAYNEAFAQNLTVRSQLSNARQDAEDALLSSVTLLVLHPATTPDEKAAANTAFVTAFQNYQAADAAYTAQKDANPLPPIPSC